MQIIKYHGPKVEEQPWKMDKYFAENIIWKRVIKKNCGNNKRYVTKRSLAVSTGLTVEIESFGCSPP